MLKLDLRNVGLAGSLSTAIGGLGALTSLGLHENSLSGSLPSQLGQLTKLQWLGLSNNEFTGSLPTAIGGLEALTLLNLQENGLSGSLPSELWLLTNLKSLDLDKNKLTGPLPTTVGNMTSLTHLDLSDNQLSRPLPLSLGALTALIMMRLTNNKFSGTLPTTAGNLVALTNLAVSANNLTGTLPSEIWLLTKMKVLDARSNKFTGTLPTAVSNLVDLTYLNLAQNLFNGLLYSSIGFLTDMTLLDLHENSLSGSVPSELWLLTNLKSLDLGKNKLTGSLPTTVGNMTSLTHLDVRENFLGSSLPSELGLLNKLNELNLDNCTFTGLIPATLGKLVSLKSLGLSGNKLKGTIPQEFKSLPSLFQALRLDYNRLSGTIPDIWTKFTDLGLSARYNNLRGSLPDSLMSLRELYLGFNNLSGRIIISNSSGLQKIALESNKFSGPVPIFPKSLLSAELNRNRLSGTIPSEIGASTSLQLLELRHNQINGTIPQSIFGLRSLTLLSLLNNKLSGTIDANMGRLTRLKALMLGIQTSTSGSLPTELGLISNLQILNVRDMSLTGTIPSELGKLRKLVVFNASTNFFAGTLPTELGRMRNLQQLSVYLNRIEGTLPQSLTRLSKLGELLLHGNKFSGSVDILFQNNSFPNLKYLDISDNKFNSQLQIITVPPKLKSFAAFVNCFRGKMDIEKVCGATGLESLLLDGISDRFGCVKQYWGEDLRRKWSGSVFGRLKLNLNFNSYKNTGLNGDLPSCLFSLERLHTLHLCSNNLLGNLPKLAALQSNLTNLRLSHNFLKGNIPASFQRDARQLKVLDLSANRLTGSIEKMTAPKDAIYLFGNRLSGRVSPFITNARFDKISILSGNLFECREGSRNLPQDDPEYKRYVCGSNNFETAVYVFLGFGLFIAVVGAYQVFYLGRFQRLRRLLTRNFFRASSATPIPAQLQHALDGNDEFGRGLRSSSFFSGRKSLLPPLFRPKRSELLDPSDVVPTTGDSSSRSTRGRSTKVIKGIIRDDLHAMNFVFLLSDLRAISIFFGLVAAFLLLPFYLLLKLSSFGGIHDFSIFKNEYLWTASGIFIKGSEPAVLLCFVWIVLIVVAFQLFHFAFRRQDSKHEDLLDRSAEFFLRAAGRSPSSNDPSLESSSDTQHLFTFRFSNETYARLIRGASLWSRLLIRNSIIAFISCTASLSLNFFYVYHYQFQDLTSAQLARLQVFVAVSKLSLSRVVPALKSLNFLRLGLHQRDLVKENDLEVFLALFNLIAAPFIATALTEKSCFLPRFKGADPVYFIYKLATLTAPENYQTYLEGNTTSEQQLDPIFYPVSTTTDFTFVPPAIYYYTCSSSFVRIYAAPFVISAIAKMFFYPFTSLVLRFLIDAVPALPEFRVSRAPTLSSKTSDSSRTKSVVDDARSPNLGPREVLRYALISAMPNMLRTEPERDEIKALKEACGIIQSWSSAINGYSRCFIKNNDDIEYTAYFLDASRVLLDVFLDIIVLLTFGMLCPLLALILVVAISMRCTRWQYLCENILHSDSETNWEHLNLDCARAWKSQKNVLFKLRWMIAVAPALFFILFVYDIARDDWLEDYDHAAKPISKALVCCIAILPLFLSLVLTRAAPSFVASAAHRVVRGEFGFAELANQVSQRISRKNVLPMDSAERKKHSSGAFSTKNPVHERDLQGVGVSQDQRPQQQLVPEDCGGVSGHSHGSGIELVEVIDTESSLQTYQMGLADSSDEQIRDSIPLP